MNFVETQTFGHGRKYFQGPAVHFSVNNERQVDVMFLHKVSKNIIRPDLLTLIRWVGYAMSDKQNSHCESNLFRALYAFG